MKESGVRESEAGRAKLREALDDVRGEVLLDAQLVVMTDFTKDGPVEGSIRLQSRCGEG